MKILLENLYPAPFPSLVSGIPATKGEGQLSWPKPFLSPLLEFQAPRKEMVGGCRLFLKFAPPRGSNFRQPTKKTVPLQPIIQLVFQVLTVF